MELSPSEVPAFLASLTATQIDVLRRDFGTLALRYQRPPPASANGEPWHTWLLLGGRGAGKTRAGAEWVKDIVRYGETARIALVGETAADTREVMIEGESGILRLYPKDDRPAWEPSRRRLVWKNGAVAHAFSADDPEQLRGPQFDAAWCDELCKWRRAESAYDMLQFGLRLGARPRQMITTTPRPIALLKKLIADPLTVVTRATTHDNRYNLAPTFLSRIHARYAGTRLGRQELGGEIIEDLPGALFPRALVERSRVAEAPALSRIVVAIDPPVSSREGADACGLVAAGLGADGRLYVLADETASRLTPLEWASRAIRLYRKLEADRIVVEVNQGGEMARVVIAEVDASVPMTAVRATRNKRLRAEPVAALYEQGRVSHVGSFPALEDEMAEFGPDGLSNGRSPDRLDALVWAITHLALTPAAAPRVRGF